MSAQPAASNQIQTTPAASEVEVLVPPGAMVESLLAQMDEGKVLEHADELLRHAHTELQAYANRSLDFKAKAVVTLKVELSFYEGNPELVEQKAKFKCDIPSMTRTAIAKSRAGKMLCQPIGASKHDPAQQAFFDAKGNVLTATLVDRRTGEEISQVAGRIGPKEST